MQLPPGPPFPMPLATLLWQMRFPEFMTYCRRRYGDYFTVRLPIDRKVVAISDPDGIRTVFADRGDGTHAGEGNSLLEPLVGPNSLLLLDGPRHTRQRRLVHPPFHGSRMTRYEEVIRAAADAEIDSWPKGVVFALMPSMQRLTLRVILSAVFGIAEGPGKDRVAELIRRVTAPAQGPTVLLMLAQRDIGPLRAWSNFTRDRALLDEALYAEIAQRRADPGLAGRDDILSVMLQARDEDGAPMTDVELRDQLMTLLIAGHETSATGLCWFFDQVLHHPEVEAELRHTLGEGDTAFLDATVNEVMRLRPVVGMVARKLVADMRVGPHLLPSGVVAAPNIFLVHRRPDLYPEPLQFRPRRFLGTRLESFAWMPFGGGTRRCVGADFALFEMRTVIARVIERVDLRAASAEPSRIVRRAVTLSPADGVPVVAGKND